MSKILNKVDLKPGDVVLCYKNGKFDVVGKIIKKITESDYVHAGIYIGNNIVAESMTSGLAKENLDRVLARYDHVAIFRRHDAWNKRRVRLLELFVDMMVKSQCKYNISGALNFHKLKLEHQSTLIERLDDYFIKNHTPESPIKEKYFCSEFVVDCFIATGFIDSSAAVLYNPTVISPGDLGRDVTFGYFLGYLSSDDKYEVPSEDEFYHSTTWDDIFKHKK